MAEQKSAAERTEKPTLKRLKDARSEGQIPRSKELTAFALVGAAMASMMGFGGWVGGQAMEMMRAGLQLKSVDALAPDAMVLATASGLAGGLWILVPVLATTLLMSILAPLLLGGWNLSGKALVPKGSRLNPLSGVKRMFSVKTAGELGKTILKVIFLSGVAALFAWTQGERLLGLGYLSPMAGIAQGLSLCLGVGLWMLVGLLLIALIDIPLQLYSHEKELRMTRQDVKDEHKETEGRPEIKQAQRQRQMEAAGRQNLAAVPTADVVVTNPTHFAVAIKYDPASMRAPVLLARGADLVAAHIRELAREHRVPMVSAPPLARALYHLGEVDREIPLELYKAVAQLLTYVYQLEHAAPGRQRPECPEFDLSNLPPDATRH